MSCIFGALAQANGGRVPAGSPVYVLYYFRAWDEARRAHPLHRGARRRASAPVPSPTASTSSTTSPRRTIRSSTSSATFPLRVERYARAPGLRRPRLPPRRRRRRPRRARALRAGRAGHAHGEHPGRALRRGRRARRTDGTRPPEPGHARRARAGRPGRRLRRSSAATSCASRPAAAAAGAIRSRAIPSACARTWRAASSRRAARSRTTAWSLDPVTLEIDKTATDEERAAARGRARAHRPRPGLRGGGGALARGADRGGVVSGVGGGGSVLWDLDARGVGTVTLNRPEVNNAYNGDLIQGLHEALDALGTSAGLRVLVLRGNGRHFQAGVDLRWLADVARRSPAENEQRLAHHRRDGAAARRAARCRRWRWCRADASAAAPASPPPATSWWRARTRSSRSARRAGG